MAELKTNCNTIYMDLVGMIDAINTKYQKLLEQDPSASQEQFWQSELIPERSQARLRELTLAIGPVSFGRPRLPLASIVSFFPF